METLPFSQSCENNKPFILEVLKEVFTDSTEALEIASGTGQHACYFASQMPWLQWQPTELKDNLPLLRPRCEGYEGDNLLLLHGWKRDGYNIVIVEVMISNLLI